MCLTAAVNIILNKLECQLFRDTVYKTNLESLETEAPEEPSDKARHCLLPR